MPDEYIHVSFPGAREVLSGGNPVGPTNQDLIINAGTHTFTLDGPPDYTPASQLIVVAGTTMLTPLPIAFAKIAPAPPAPPQP